jgi:MoxR-like ATPase
MSAPADRLRDLVNRVITTVESRGLFVHSRDLEIRYPRDGSKKGSTKSRRLPLIVGASVLNALVPRSAMLLVGGHGGGKTTLAKILGRMMTGKSLDEIDDGILRGHPQLTEEKMVATLKPGPLMKDGVEIVVWRRFVTDFWKIIDEVNRLTPHAQNILLSLLAEGEVKYYDQVQRCDEYCLFATLNPSDPGTFELGPPFLDRFGIAVPITMPSINDLELILASRDERLFGFDELWQVPAVLNVEELLTIWNLADKIVVPSEASEFMRSLVREFGACIRVDKSQSSGLTVETGLCDGCHFNTAKSVCNKVAHPLSVRAAKDLNRFTKAAAWLVGATEVSVEIVKSLAPLVFWHRTRYLRDELERAPFYGDRFAFTAHLVELAAARFAQRYPAVELMDKLKAGEDSKEAADKLKEMAKSDLLVQLDYAEYAKELKKTKYVKIVREMNSAISKRNVDTLSKLMDDLQQDTEMPNRSVLLNRISEALHKMTLTQFEMSFEEWSEVWTTISLLQPQLTQILKDTLVPPKRRVARTDGLTVVVYVTGDSPDSRVFLEVSGGSTAVDLKDELEKQLNG